MTRFIDKMNITDIRENNSSELLVLNQRLLAKLLINILTLFSVSFAIIVSLFIIVYVCIIYKLQKHSPNSFNVSLLLTCNTCFSIICSSVIHIMMQLSSISGDRNIVALKWIIVWGCQVRGYLLSVFINSIYVSYVLQAGYRLFRVVFHEYRSLQSASLFLCYILVLWIISFIALVPTLISGENLRSSIVYLPDDFYCQVPVTDRFVIIYLALIVYVSPLSCLCIIYLWIIVYIRRRSGRRKSVTASANRRHNKRDSAIMRRICIVVASLLVPVVVSVIFFLIFVINGNFHWAFYRLNGMAISISYAFICLSSVYITPEIFRPIRNLLRSLKRNRQDLCDSISMHRNTKTSTKTIRRNSRGRSSIPMIELGSFQRRTLHTESANLNIAASVPIASVEICSCSID